MVRSGVEYNTSFDHDRRTSRRNYRNLLKDLCQFLLMVKTT
uniref:Uncharacterized protein n=1 Tax=Strigamia maritima TaxID=126957 RepID=T1JKH0_STRMM